MTSANAHDRILQQPLSSRIPSSTAQQAKIKQRDWARISKLLKTQIKKLQTNVLVEELQN